MGKKYSEENILRRIMSIPKIHDAIKNKEDLSKFSNIDKITYILWRDGYTRNSDIALSIEFYKQFHSEYIQDDDAIKLEDLYNVPKMYDIQRTRANIQNTQGLFPATEEVQQARLKRAKEFREHYSEQKRKTFRGLPDYYMYMDESGKNAPYFVLAGILLNGKNNVQSQKLRFNDLKKRLNTKHKLNIEELKFTDINKRNLDFYKDYLNEIFREGAPFTFLSIIVENKGLKRKTEQKKTKYLLEIFLKELTSVIVRSTCGSPYAEKSAKLHITLDKDSEGYDAVAREKIKQELDLELKQYYKYLIALDDFKDVDSKDEIYVQIADLYASSLSNIFSGIKADSDTAKCKKEFAQLFLNNVGITKIDDSFPVRDKSKIENYTRYINKFITSEG